MGFRILLASGARKVSLSGVRNTEKDGADELLVSRASGHGTLSAEMSAERILGFAQLLILLFAIKTSVKR